MQDAIDNSRPLRVKAYQEIRGRLVEGSYQQGSKVSDFTLARELEISRAPIREALNQLVSEGFLVQRPGLGTFVHTPSRKEIGDLFQLREWIELAALPDALKRINSADLDRLEQSCHEIRKLAVNLSRSGKTLSSGEEFRKLNESDALFHLTVLRATGNDLAAKMLRDNRILEQLWSFYVRTHDGEKIHSICDEHESILEAVQSRNLRQCRKALRHHLKVAKESALEKFDSLAAATAQDHFSLT